MPDFFGQRRARVPAGVTAARLAVDLDASARSTVVARRFTAPRRACQLPGDGAADFLTFSLAFSATRSVVCDMHTRARDSQEDPPWRSDWATTPRTSPPRPPKAPSTSTTTSATAGACCSRTRRTSRRSAPPSSARSPSSSREFDKRNVKVIGLSASTRSTPTRAGPSDIEETQGAALNFPLIADPDRKVADLYDMIHPNANDTMTVRSVFVIGPDKKVKLILTYPASTGPQLRRDPAGHRLAAAHRQLQVATPVNWKDGDDVIIAGAVSDEDAKDEVPEGLEGARSPTCGSRPSPTSSSRSACSSSRASVERSRAEASLGRELAIGRVDAERRRRLQVPHRGRPGCRPRAPRSAGGTRSTCRWSRRSRSPGPGSPTGPADTMIDDWWP